MTRTFQLHRDHDVSGLSGTGVVADGVTFPDGVTVIRWRGERQSTVVWPSVDDVVAIHGHGGATRLVWDDPAPAPSVVSDAAGLGDRIAALSARLAAVGFPACTCHPGDDDSERCLPSPQDWRAEIERAALSSTTLTAAPSATREATEDEVTEVVTEALTDAYRAERGMSRHTGLTAHDESVIRDQAAHVVSLADARFNITPKEDR